jgi:tetratricopeptide (TPR) repeat protein
MRRSLLTLSVLVISAGLFGCQGLTDRQIGWLDGGEQAYGAGQYDQAINQLSRFILDASNRPEAARALYVRGLARAQVNQRLAARTDMIRCVNSATDADVRWRAYTVLGTIDYEDRQWASAARSYAAAVDFAPASPPTDFILFRLGTCYERMGRWSDALLPFQRIVNQFPSGSAHDAAQRRLRLRADCFSIQCGAFSSERNAAQLVDELKRDGLEAYARTDVRNGTPMYLVMVGPYARYEDAAGDLEHVRTYAPDGVLWP